MQNHRHRALVLRVHSADDLLPARTLFPASSLRALANPGHAVSLWLILDQAGG